ncbi:MAG TPA: copper resistance protein CopZ [Spirochaetia bacterium]|nr:MAG: hypothetical protein A2Y41_06115 [Spirochaetes bacterium GWB1_36_13]HCL55680.1 copper resistance protein CopZ [Spirochaetia bacterium]
MKKVLKVDGMSCMHCVMSVKKSVGKLDGIKNIDVDLKAKTVSVEWDEALTPLKNIESAITNAGYQVIAKNNEEPI